MNNKKINWKEKAKEMYKAGHDYSAISKALGINNNTIAKAFSRVPITERVAMKQDYYKNVIIPEPVELAGDDEQVPEKIDKGDYFIVNSNKVSVSITKIKLKLLKNLYQSSLLGTQYR